MPDSGKGRVSRDSTRNTLVVAIGVSFVCSILVAGASVLLKPRQAKNEELYRQRIVLDVAGLYEPGIDIDDTFSTNVAVRLVDLSSGNFVDTPDASTFDPVAAAQNPDLSTPVPSGLDIAGIRRRANYAPIYIVEGPAADRQIILPVHGYGLWSTMYGFLALDSDGTTVRGLQFYEHAETPGLGDQIDDGGWQAQWRGKQLFDESGAVRLTVIRGQVRPGEQAIYEVDGLSGATLTGRGVTNLIHYWAGQHGFGPFLSGIRQEAKTVE
ncbi:MAG: Na(+)-translocating NADH-quinone reductase subunit C [Gammaproteobacteria bacterium]|nr:Na(+)-translocating NADH-quinone reductase subunit C [Gammaproteobacteria bacterium]